MILSHLIITEQQSNLFAFNDSIQSLLQWIDNLGNLGIIIFICIYILAAVFLIPASILTLGAGFLFGLTKGSIFVSLASTLGAIFAFLVGRYFARGWVVKQIESHPKFKAIDEAVAKEAWKIVGLTRLSPLFPFVFLNYAFSVTKVSLKDYALASWIGMIPGTIMYVYIGSLAKDITNLSTGNAEANVLQWIIRIIGFIATVVVTIYITKIAKKALDSQIIE